MYNLLQKTLDENAVAYTDNFSTEKTRLAFSSGSGVSDYTSFEKKNIPNVQIAQQRIEQYILNKNDTLENLDFKKIDELVTVLCKYIINIDF